MHPLVERFYNETKWKDKCLLLELIHVKMRVASNKTGRQKWRIKDTAKMLSLSVGLVSEDLQLARAIVTDAAIKSCKSRNTAIKLMREKR